MKELINKGENKSTKKSTKKEAVENPKQFEEQRSENLRMKPQPLTKKETK